MSEYIGSTGAKDCYTC